MFRWMSQGVIAAWPIILLVWLVALIAAKWSAPDWDSVATDGELRHLPASYPSRVATDLYEKAFPDDITDSSILIVLHRDDAKLTQADERFVVETLVPGLKEVAEQFGGVKNEKTTQELLRERMLQELAGVELDIEATPEPEGDAPKEEAPESGAGESNAADSATEMPQIVSIDSIADYAAGPLLRSADGQATLISINLTSGFLKSQNTKVVGAFEDYVERLREQEELPEDLKISLAGSAMVGADTIEAVTESTHAVRRWAYWIVIALLLLVFRAPIAAVLPLATMYIAVEIAIAILAWSAYFEWIEVFDGLVLYVSVIVYGAGVDYSLFIISRHREEMAQGEPLKEGVQTSLMSAGTAVAASAGTEIVGIGLLVFAEFGKFQQAGLGIALGLLILLLASLTLTPALLCMTGRWAFWPAKFSKAPKESQEPEDREEPSEESENYISRLWRRIGQTQEKFPGRIWLVTMAVLLPIAIFGLLKVNNQTYDLTSSLPDESPSVEGLKVIREHFSEGATGPITLLIHDPEIDFSTVEGIDVIATLTQRLEQRSEELHIDSIRSVADPLGTSERAEQIINLLGSIFPRVEFLEQGELIVPSDANLGPLEQLVQLVVRELAYLRFVSQEADYENHVTWLTITPSSDPYASETIEQLDKLESTTAELLPEEAQDAELHFMGATASLRDVRDVARRDFIRIAVMIPLGVLLVLMLLLRKVIVPIYLIFTVLLTFFVVIGTTSGFFWLLDGSEFSGLQWTVPVLLFVLLMAVGEDYSVLLVTRTDEEQAKHGPVAGITEALVGTGGLISGAGLIMAGTFSALAFGGELRGMHQLGFALAFGMLLDTFIVRPLLVPSFQHLLHKWYK